MLFSIDEKRVPHKQDRLLSVGVDQMTTQQHDAILQAMNQHVNRLRVVDFKWLVGHDWPHVYGPIYAAMDCKWDWARKLGGVILLDVMHDRPEKWYIYKKPRVIRNEDGSVEEVEVNVYFRKKRVKGKPISVFD